MYFSRLSFKFTLIFYVLCLAQVLACETFIRRFEKQHNIPEKLLSAIALIESGRRFDGERVAWPWTINANGVPYVFETKKEAIAKVKELQSKGIRSIDVGCMQINLLYHPNAFSSIEAAFDPETNIAYAADFLKQKMVAQGTWQHAVAHYHSATQSLNVPYKNKVLQTWGQILDQPLLLPNVSVPAVTGAIRVPSTGLGQRRDPVNVQFKHYFRSGNKFERKIKKEGTFNPRIHRLSDSKRANFKSKLTVTEQKIPLEIFAANQRNKYALTRSARFPHHRQEK
jgi:hypothetical protein